MGGANATSMSSMDDDDDDDDDEWSEQPSGSLCKCSSYLCSLAIIVFVFVASILRVLLQFALDGDIAGIKARVAGARRRYYEEDCCQIWEGGSRLFNGILDFSYGGAGDFLRIFCGDDAASLRRSTN